MSEIADAARVSIFLADYVATDAVNKVNAIGIGWKLRAWTATRSCHRLAA